MDKQTMVRQLLCEAGFDPDSLIPVSNKIHIKRSRKPSATFDIGDLVLVPAGTEVIPRGKVVGIFARQWDRIAQHRICQWLLQAEITPYREQLTLELEPQELDLGGENPL